MPRDIPEPDWKLFRQLRTIALDRFCGRVLAEIEGIAADPAKTNHERYLAIWDRIKERDRELADTFDAPRRSRAFEQLAFLGYHGLLTDEERARFSPEAREVLQLFNPNW